MFTEVMIRDPVRWLSCRLGFQVTDDHCTIFLWGRVCLTFWILTRYDTTHGIGQGNQQSWLQGYFYNCQCSLQSIRRQFRSTRTCSSSKNEAKNKTHQHQVSSLPWTCSSWHYQDLPNLYRESTGGYLHQATIAEPIPTSTQGITALLEESYFSSISIETGSVTIYVFCISNEHLLKATWTDTFGTGEYILRESIVFAFLRWNYVYNTIGLQPSISLFCFGNHSFNRIPMVDSIVFQSYFDRISAGLWNTPCFHSINAVN